MVPTNDPRKIFEHFTKKIIEFYQPLPPHTNMNGGAPSLLSHPHLETVWWRPVKYSCPILNKYPEKVERKGLGRGWEGEYYRTKNAEEKDF